MTGHMDCIQCSLKPPPFVIIPAHDFAYVVEQYPI